MGRLQTRTYDDKEGNKRYVTEVVVSEQFFADSKKSSYDEGGSFEGHAQPSFPKAQPTSKPAEGFVPISQEFDDDDDLPF